MTILKQQENLNIDLTAAQVVLTYTHPADAPAAIVIPRLDLGVPDDRPIAGDARYRAEALIDGGGIAPYSEIDVPAGQTMAVLQGRAVAITPGDSLTVQLRSDSLLDSDVNVTACLFDSTPLRRADLDGLSGGGEVEIDHNYGGADKYAYLTDTGVGVDNATILVFLKSDYDAGRKDREDAKAASKTNVHGRWIQPVMLDPGQYVVYFYKQHAYGPDTATLTVV